VTVLVDIAKKHEDLQILRLVIDIVNSVSNKRIGDLADKVCWLALGPNLLRNPLTMFTLTDVNKGFKEGGSSLVEGDLEFEIEVPA
jgi:hypothetical protein